MLAGQDPDHHLDETLRQQAERCRRLADSTYDRHTRQTLRQMAEHFDASAREIAQKRNS